jgi:tetratricopeptide (TPR) repeat protein
MLGALHEGMGDYAKAEPLYRQALEIKKRMLGENHPGYATSLNNLRMLYYGQGQLAAAEQVLGRGLTLLTKWTKEGLASLGERQRIRLLEQQRNILSAYFSVAPAAGIKAEEIYHHVLAWKGIVEASQDEDRLARDRPELKETLRQLEQARARLAHLAFTVPLGERRQAWLEQLNALRDGKENLESDLAHKSSAFRQFRETLLNNPGLVTARRAELAKQRGIDEKPEKLPENGRPALAVERAMRSDPSLWAAFVLSGDVK